MRTTEGDAQAQGRADRFRITKDADSFFRRAPLTGCFFDVFFLEGYMILLSLIGFLVIAEAINSALEDFI